MFTLRVMFNYFRNQSIPKKLSLRGASVVAALSLMMTVPATGSAMLIGVESNSEFVNSDRVPALQNPAIRKANNAGAQIIRANVGWVDVARNCAGQTPAQLRAHGNSCYRWEIIDNLVVEAKKHNIQLLFSVSRAPAWLHNNSEAYIGGTPAEWARTVQHYSAFIAAAATRYRPSSPYGEVRHWTIWNEPNSKTFWQPMSTAAQKRIAPARYAILYANAAKEIRSRNMRAQIAPGPTGPRGTVPPQTFIAGFQNAVQKRLPGKTIALKRRYISAWAHNPYPGYGSPRLKGTIRAPQIGMANFHELPRQLDRKALTKGLTVWATEFGWQTPPEPALFVRPAVQGTYLSEAFDILDKTKRVSIAINYGLTDPTNLDDWQSGLFYANGKAKPALYWFRRPIAVSHKRVKRGGYVEVWAKSNLMPSSTRIAYSYNGSKWYVLPLKGRRADGSIRVQVKVNRDMRFAVRDNNARGRAVMVRVR